MSRPFGSLLTDNRNKRGIAFVLLALCAVAILYQLFAQRPHEVAAQSPVKLWTVDLAADKDFQKRLGVLEVSLNPPFINFLNDSQIICDFYEGGKIGFNPSLKRYGYHVLEIDAQNGALGRKLDFQSVDDHSRTFPVADGGFVVLAGEQLKRFNSGFAPGPSLPTPIESPNRRPDLWLMDIAPGGQPLLLYHHRAGDDHGIWTWLRATDLSTINSIQGPLTSTIQASDVGGLLYATSGAELLSARKTTVLCDKCNAYFLTDDLVFLAHERTYSIETISGKERASGNLDVHASDFTRSALTSRFAYSTGHYVGGGFPIQTNFDSVTSKIMVVDWSTNKPIAEVDINEPVGNPSAGLAQTALALSSDGKYLAVLLHHTLSLYRLP